MGISSERLRELTETKIGQGQSKYVFGKGWEELYEVMSKEETNLTEEMFMEGLTRCKFRDPEKVGLMSFLCPPLTTYITDRVMGNIMKDVYRFTIYIWYFILIVTIVSSLIDWKMDKQVPFMVLCMIVTSWSFRNWSRDYNKLELIFHTLNVDGKLDRVLKQRRE
jgi:hypothetical protein